MIDIYGDLAPKLVQKMATNKTMKISDLRVFHRSMLMEAANKSITVSSVAKDMGMSRTTTTHCFDRLEKAGLFIVDRPMKNGRDCRENVRINWNIY